ncbi:DUF1642 domain-containing protein [Listeria monocytogenes]|uniref:DUF1642 domain-containing protein n=1 Tax=Listeria monocytogenes TaxID=1639 RepID=UPI00083D07BE|nr:DUF1642 domain-containing protein [Listeria monocytogenes]NVX14026.1 DUF1642 domain-containing protein [Listeria monocytogenes]NVX36646.1 DUF1642 domain-containing protein [Listeria monocytogenes]NVX90318.1 DUF1642 domain-containing protein [Listeria monocytogenes]NVY79890.1 DUF1642 domain-containing protein [Listeria monocytogenes]NVY85677.1 DUF1642 domain-containing protein [Listeria monocytogenes]
MKFKEGDKVNFIDKGRLHVGTILDFDTKGQTNFKVGYDTSDRESRKWWLGKVEVWVSESHLAVFELPQVPQYVDDWIQTGKSHARTLLWSFNIKNPEMPHSMVDWLCDNTDNQELFARAWLGEYEVEKEPLYYVKLADSRLDYLRVDKTTGKTSISNPKPLANCRVKFTEKEIKELDERYWQFKVPVEEVEGE